MSKFVAPFNWTQAEIHACERGISNGWDSQNYRDAYGDDDGEEPFADEGIRRGMALFLRSDERMAWLSGWFVGRTRFAAGEFPDGTRDTFGMTIEARVEGRESVDGNGTYVKSWSRVINGVKYVFVRVEDGNRNAYIDAVRAGECVHTFKGRATGPLSGVQNISASLGKMIGL